MTDMLSFASAFASPQGGEAHGAVRALALARLNSTRRRISAALESSGQPETAEALLAFTAGQGSAWRPETGLALQSLRSQATPELSTLRMAALQLAAACAGATALSARPAVTFPGLCGPGAGGNDLAVEANPACGLAALWGRQRRS